MAWNRAAAVVLVLFLPLMTYAKNSDKDLVTAAKKGVLSEVEALLEAGADVNTKTEDGTTALIAAAGGGYTAVVLRLVQAGADVNARTEKGQTALKAAEASGDSVIALVLLHAGAEVDEDNDKPPLVLAQPGVRVMRGAPHHRVYIPARPPLMEAAAQGDTEAVKALLEAGADANEREAILGQTALDLAKENGHTEVVALLQKAGAKEAKQ